MLTELPLNLTWDGSDKPYTDAALKASTLVEEVVRGGGGG